MAQRKQGQPVRVIHAVAPIRICDNGGWTDTWFAEHGKIFNIAVTPYVEVEIAVYPREERVEQITLNAQNYAERIEVKLDQLASGRHALLTAAIAECAPPEHVSLDIKVWSDMPAGASTGTSATVIVALLGALAALRFQQYTAHEIAYRAHRVETERLGLQSGIQDQLCAAYGGINFIEVYSYPHATVSQIEVPELILRELEQRLILVFLGKTHSSSAVHKQVITRLESVGSAAAELEALRRAAQDSYIALTAGDFVALGQAMIDNTAAQHTLHVALIGSDASQLIEVAQQHGALGWKVNGAGGEGGSVTLLCNAASDTKQALLQAILRTNPLFQIIPITLSRSGLRVWDVNI